MNALHEYPSELLLLLFLIITFLQSGIDKLTDWKGNLSWLKGHFKESIFKNTVPLLLSIVLIFEVVAAVLCIGGIIHIIAHHNIEFAFYGAILSCITLLMLLIGQRIAKDYEGAKTIVIYFIPAVLLVYLLQA